MFKNLFKKSVEKTQIETIKENGVVYSLLVNGFGYLYYTDINCINQCQVDVYDNETVDFIEDRKNGIKILRGQTKEELFQKSLSL